MAVVAIVAFVFGALFGCAATVLVILAYGMLHARRSRRAEVSVTANTESPNFLIKNRKPSTWV
jgi:hypothetical protein